jgi:electron transfer flavoprotein beta subunit
VLLRALATGVDEAILIDLPHHNDVESLTTARIIATEVAKHEFDLVLAGQSSDDYESGQVGPQIAETLNWSHVSLVTHVDVRDRLLIVNRDAEASKETIELSPPAVLMVLSGREESQRFPSLKGMIAAKKKTIPVVDVGEGAGPSRLEWSVPTAVEREADGIIVHGAPAEEAAGQLIAWLKEQKLI